MHWQEPDMLRTLTALFLSMVMTAATATAAPQTKTTDSKPNIVEKTTPLQPEAQVVVYDKPLFAIKARLFSFTAADRANVISTRLSKLIKDPLFSPDSLKTIDGDSTSDIYAGDIILMSVTEADALVEKKPRQVLAAELANRIRAAVEAHNKAYSMNSLMMGALYSFLATLVLIILLAVIKRFSPKVIAKIENLRGTYIRTIRFQSIELLKEERITALIVTTIRVTRVILLLGIFYLYIPLVLSFFPWTRGIADKLFDYILLPVEKVGMAFVTYLPNIFFLLVIIVLTHYATKLVKFFFSEVEKQTIIIPGFFHDWAEPTFNIVRFLIFAFAAVVAFPYLPGSDSPAFKGVSVFLGVLFSLGSTSAVSNVVAGVILTYMRAFKLGDRVKIAETVGDIVEKNLLVTRIRTIKNVDITVPNAMVLGSHITNFSSSAQNYGLILHTTVTIGYDAPWRLVYKLLISAASATENILELPTPFVLQTSLDDFYVSYQINAYTDKPSVMALTYSELHQNIQEKFNEAGVEIMSPHYAQIRDGNRTAIPDQYLPEGYEPAALRIFQKDKDERN